MPAPSASPLRSIPSPSGLRWPIGSSAGQPPTPCANWGGSRWACWNSPRCPASKQSIGPLRSEEADALLVFGGDVLYLSRWMRESGLADLLPSLRETVYVGVSAGSMVTAPMFGETYDDPEKPFVIDRAWGWSTSRCCRTWITSATRKVPRPRWNAWPPRYRCRPTGSTMRPPSRSSTAPSKSSPRGTGSCLRPNPGKNPVSVRSALLVWSVLYDWPHVRSSARRAAALGKPPRPGPRHHAGRVVAARPPCRKPSACWPRCCRTPGAAVRVGLTGVPGVGKSTLHRGAGAATGRRRAQGGGAGGRSQQPAHRRQHPGRQDPHAQAGGASGGLYPAQPQQAARSAAWPGAPARRLLLVRGGGLRRGADRDGGRGPERDAGGRHDRRVRAADPAQRRRRVAGHQARHHGTGRPLRGA